MSGTFSDYMRAHLHLITMVRKTCSSAYSVMCWPHKCCRCFASDLLESLAARLKCLYLGIIRKDETNGFEGKTKKSDETRQTNSIAEESGEERDDRSRQDVA